MRSTYFYFICFLLCVSSLAAQTTNKTDSVKPKEIVKNSIGFDIDLVSIVTSALGTETYNFEGAVHYNIQNKYLAILECGLAGANKASATEVNFKTSAPFAKIGLDFNIVKPSVNPKNARNMFLLGARVGATNFSYDISNYSVTDTAGVITLQNYQNQNATKLWFEIVASVRVDVYRNIYMGWSVRNKQLITNDAIGAIVPWFIPGYGLNASGNWGVNYVIGLRF